MLGHIQDWQNRLLPAASDYLPTVLLSTCQSVKRAQSSQKARASDLCVCFWKVREVLLEAAVTAKLLSASKKSQWLARTLLTLSLPAKSYPFPSQELPGPHPSSLGSKIQLCPHTALSQLWVSEWVHHDGWEVTTPTDAKLVDLPKPLLWVQTWRAGSAAQVTTANPQQFPA